MLVERSKLLTTSSTMRYRYNVIQWTSSTPAQYVVAIKFASRMEYSGAKPIVNASDSSILGRGHRGR